MKKLIVATFVAILSTPAVLAAPPTARIAAYATQSDIDDGAGFNDDGVGFGVRGWAFLGGPFFVHGEYQTAETDDFEVDLESMRIGGGFAGKIQEGTMWFVAGEYVDFGDFNADFDQAGFGVHGGLVLGVTPALQLFGSLGYLTTDDTDGLEVDVGAHFAFNKQWGGVVDYRTYMGSVDDTAGGDDLDLNSIRAGVTLSFGG